MEQQSKYYTPDISEFKIGFEFESKYVLFGPVDIWTKVTLNMDDHMWFWDEYKSDAYPTEFRVKYLDSEDIESLGFKKKDGESYYVFTKYKLGGNDFLIEFHDGNIKIIYNVYMRLPKCLFDGRIKNKSELIQVLKMVGIL